MTMERLFLNPSDFARLRAQAENDSNNSAPRDTLFGVPVHASHIIPEGQVLRVRPQPMIPITFQGLDWLCGPVRFRYGFDLLPGRRQFTVLDVGADGWTPKWLTKAQRRRAAKRFIRDEIARRRMERIGR